MGRGFGAGAGAGAPRGRWGMRFGPNGWCEWWRTSGLPEWLRDAVQAAAGPVEPVPTEQERQMLGERVEQLRAELDRIERRLEELGRADAAPPPPVSEEQS